MLSIVTAGLPISAKEIIVKASVEVFGEGGADLIVLDADKLRSRVRMSQRNPSDVLVILDSVSHDKCSDIENGLYISDKYLEYTSDEELVNFLNSKFSLNLEFAKEESMEFSSESSRESEEIIDRLKAQLMDQEELIEGLQYKIKELSQGRDSEVSTCSIDESALEELKQENLNLRNQILELESKLKNSDISINSLREERDSLAENLENLKSRQNQLLSDYKLVTDELAEYKVKYSTQSGLLSAKDSEIEAIKSELMEETGSKQRLKLVEDEKELAEKHLMDAQVETSQLKVDLSAKEAELVRLREQLNNGGLTNEQRENAESKLREAEERIVSLEKEVLELKSKLESEIREKKAQGSKEGILKSNLESVKRELESLREKVKEYDSTIIDLNTELIRAKSTAEMLEKSTSRDTDIEGMFKEISSLQSRLDTINQSVFGKMSSFSNPKTSLMLSLVSNQTRYSNIRFAFSGSTESRKGTYRSLLDEFRQLPNNEKVVIVDVTCETCVDYVFEIKKVVTGLNWFIKGGGIQQYLSQTCLQNVQVLSPGLGYINDIYFLTVDWESRLKELENSGYNVVVYLGDLSSLVGRVFHESFANLGTSMIYIHGNAIGARSIVSNLKGLSNSKESIVCYFEYNKKVERFYNMVAESNECRIISML